MAFHCNNNGWLEGWVDGITIYVFFTAIKNHAPGWGRVIKAVLRIALTAIKNCKVVMTYSAIKITAAFLLKNYQNWIKERKFIQIWSSVCNWSKWMQSIKFNYNKGHKRCLKSGQKCHKHYILTLLSRFQTHSNQTCIIKKEIFCKLNTYIDNGGSEIHTSLGFQTFTIQNWKFWNK